MQSEGGTALPSSQKIGLCRDLKEKNPKRARGTKCAWGSGRGFIVHRRVQFPPRAFRPRPSYLGMGAVAGAAVMAEFIAPQRNGGRLYAAQAHRHRCNCSDPCYAGSGTTGRRDDGDNAEPVARGDYCGQSRTGRVASPSLLAPALLAPALLALVFPPVLAATTMGLVLAPSPASPPPCTARDRENS